MPELFVSYSRDDTFVIERIVERLEQLGFDLWIDVEDLPPGTPAWNQAIDTALRRADGVLAFLSPTAMVSRWCNIETMRAQEFDKPIYPLLLSGNHQTAIPIHLTDVNYVDLRNDADREQQFEQLVNTLCKELGHVAPQSVTNVHSNNTPKVEHEIAASSSRRSFPWVRISSIGVVVIASIVLGSRMFNITPIGEPGVNEQAIATLQYTFTPPAEEAFETLTPTPTSEGENKSRDDIDSAKISFETVGELTLQRTLRDQGGSIWDLDWAPDNSMISTTSVADRIIVSNIATGSRVYTIDNNSQRGVNTEGILVSSEWSPDGSILAEGRFLSLHLWNVETWGVDLEMESDDQQTNIFGAIGWSPDGQYIATAGNGGIHLTIFNATTGQFIGLNSERNLSLYNVFWSPDSSMIATPADEGLIIIWKASQLQVQRIIHAECLETGKEVSWSHDSSILISYCRDERTASIWDVTSGERITEYTIQYTDNLITSVAISPDGELLAIGSSKESESGTETLSHLIILHTNTGEPLWSFEADTNTISNVRWSPDGTMLAASDFEGQVYIWGIP